MKKKLYIIDGHALCYRAYYAFIRNPLTNSKGQNTSAIFGFARMLYRLVADQKPDFLAVAFDPPKKSFRFRMYSEYKANRQKMPDDLRSQIDEIKNMVAVLGIARLELDDYEADDILGTMAEKFASKSMEVVLVTGDKDAYQLLNKNVRIYANRKGISEYEIYDEENITQKTGLRPEQIIDYMALTGDASDNIPGVKGIGEKSALKLIETYGSLDSIYRHIDDIKGKQKELLQNSHEMALLSKDLVTIRRDAPLEPRIDDMALPDLASPEAREYFRGLEMASIINDFFGDETGEKQPPQPAKNRDYAIIRNEKSLRDALERVRAEGLVSIDTETTSVSPVDADIVGVSLSISEAQGWYIPLVNRGLFSEDYLDPSISLKLLKPVLEDPGIQKVGQNIKYDYIVLKNSGIELEGIHFDTMIASYVLNPNERRHNLDDLAMKHLNYRTITFKELVGTGQKAVPITEVELERLAEYAIEDADIALRLYRVFSKTLTDPELLKLFTGMEMPLVTVLAEMERAGVLIDTSYLKTLGEENQSLLESVEKKIHAAADQEFNINSTRELSYILFEKLGLKKQKKTKTGYSTDIGVLEALKGSHEIIDSLIAYRTLSKLKNTYIDTLPALISPRTGRIHTSYNQTVAATGRLSSSDPNLQNIPVRDEFGKNIRKGFVPRKGHLLMSADYSQIELRLAAHLSGDASMIRAFKEGIDIHALTASSVFSVPIDNVTQDMRRQAKIINFATIYGVSPFGLSQQADIGVREAADFIRKYFETYPGFREYIDNTIAFARENGYVKTLCGRRRNIPEIDSETSFRREGAERVAINTPIQGTSADMIKIAMIDISREFTRRKLSSKMIMQVHDELVFEVLMEEKKEAGTLVREKMERALDLDVPVVVSLGWGKNWEEAH
ncbi:MAG TPA: DNA polymerase I [Spirochaetota bacterium]|nr:DNA polymerase I [Spirochaetota bacterium]HPI91235.1 DNA polymerase I [Spirochaetota bacterium]